MAAVHLLNRPNDGRGTTQCTVLIEKQVKTHKEYDGDDDDAAGEEKTMISADNGCKALITRQVEDVLSIYFSFKWGV